MLSKFWRKDQNDKGKKMVLSRPRKLTDTQTMLYEIDMLRETVRSLVEGKGQSEFGQWILLEAFLLHYRNLIEFFGRPSPRDTDLSIEKPENFWTATNRPEDAALARLGRRDLWTKYEGTSNQYSISKYLQHCTEHRTEAKEWEVGRMYDEIRETIEEFERLLPDKTRPWVKPKDQPRFILGPTSYSTTTMSEGGSILPPTK